MAMYSLSRMRAQQPRPPFWVGGEYLLHDSGYLRDSAGGFELEGAKINAESGDLLWVEVLDVRDSIIVVGQCKVIHRSKIERNSPHKPHAPHFARFVNDVRAYLLSLGLEETFTPTLVPCPGLEPSLEPFVTEVTRGSVKREVYLPTSPEIHLKKAMAFGMTDIFEIKNCFRRGEFSEHHENEFIMLEWYRGFADLDLVIDDLQGLLERLHTKAIVTDFASLFREVLNFELKPETSSEELLALCLSLEIDTHNSDTFTDLFHRLMIEKIEPYMASRGPLIVRRFPPSMAALAQLDSDGWADRFEFYWNGLEIANAFNEVTDPAEQLRRWEYEQSERLRLGTSVLPQDPDLILALEKGIPPTGGIALGLERLYMASVGVADIRELRLFSSADLLK